MKRPLSILLGASVLAGLLPIIAQGPSPKNNAAAPDTRQPERQQQSRGERVFKQNCARCHEAPQSFPPQIAGTVIRHMRVRASLSTADEKAVMEFMNP